MLTNDDLVLVGPLLRVGGAGRVDIPNRTLAYRVDPKIAASLDGQGGSGDLHGFVPVRVEGPWDRPRIYPEIEGILQDPKGALDQLRKLGGGLFGGVTGEGASDGDAGRGVQDQIDQLLGGPDGAAAPEAPPALPEEPPAPPPAPAGQTAAPGQPPADAAPPSPDASAPQPEAPPPEVPPAAPPPETTPPATEPSSEPPADPTAPPADPAADLLKSLLGQ
jgi:AsmA protein